MRPIIIIIFCFLPTAVFAQTGLHPANNDTINYIHVLFTMPGSNTARGYDIAISSDKTDFRKHIVARASDSIPQILIKKGLAFGRQYYWQYSYRDAEGRQTFTSPVSGFYIAGSPLADTSRFRTTVTVNEKAKTTDGYIIVDNGAIVTREGKTIWTFPRGYKTQEVRNLQLNKDGNLTFIDVDRCYETDLEGKVLWQGPMKLGKYDIAAYHHDIRKLDNGNFLCIAQKQTIAGKIPFDIIFEISRDNKVIWLVDEEQLYQPYDSSFRAAHINSIYLDKEGKYLYLSNRDLSSIMKINVQTARAEYAIGYALPQARHYKNEWFNMQHAASLTNSGDILLFNNNANMQRNEASSVMILTQPAGNRLPQLKWEHVFNSRDRRDNQVRKFGDAQEMANGNILISGGMAGRTFEITKDQEIVWEGRHEVWDSSLKQMVPAITYRADFTESLYPCRFDARFDQQRNLLLITNTGSVPDGYKYSFSKNGKLLTTAETLQLQPGVSVNINLPAGADRAEISSVLNSNRKVQISFP